jgi:hypothetical protein
MKQYVNFVGCDPGKDNLFFATNGKVTSVTKDNGKTYRKTETFRYSNAQRKFEMKCKIYDKRREQLKTKKVIMEETKLSKYNANTCKWPNMMEYMKIKNEVNEKLFGFYKKYEHRQLKWYTYINKERSESNMLNRFKDKFGSPKDTLILMGDWSENRPKKYQEPTKGKSLRKLFINKGHYKLYLVNEYCTSKMMYQTGEELVKFKWDESTHNYIHRLLGSKRLRMERDMSKKELEKSKKNLDGLPTIMNRDLNGSLNIRLKGLCHLSGKNLPEYFNRKEKPPVKSQADDIVKKPEKITKIIKKTTKPSRKSKMVVVKIRKLH